MTAGRGILHREHHSEAFTRNGGTLEMVQLWVNLPARDKLTDPGYQTLLRDEIPTVALPDGAGSVRVVAGRLGPVTGPARTRTPMAVWDARLTAGATARLPLPDDWNALLVVLHGTVEMDAGQEAAEGQLVVLSREGAEVVARARTDATVLVLAGEPIDEPIVGYGPFVMNTQDQIRQAIRDLEAGRFGSVPATATSSPATPS